MPGSRPQSVVDKSLKIAFVLGLLAITYLSLRPGSGPPDPGFKDKLQHASAYAAATLIGSFAFSSHRRLLAGMLIGWGILMEIGQTFVPMRSAEAADVLANLTGITLVALTLSIIRKRRPLGATS